jgi:hypothetical protein
MSCSKPIDVRMPLLAYAALMLENSMDLSEDIWSQIEALQDGDQADAEIERACTWLTEQDKAPAIGRMVQMLCEDSELVEDVEHRRWAQLVALPIMGQASRFPAFAQAWARQDFSRLRQTGRVPPDAQFHWLPFTYTGVTVDRWWTAQRRTVLELAMDSMSATADVQRDVWQRIGESLQPAGRGPAHHEVHLLLGFFTSHDMDWLENPSGMPGAHLLQMGVDFDLLVEDTLNALAAEGIDGDVGDEAFEARFQQTHGMTLDEASERVAQAHSAEHVILDRMAESLGIPQVQVHQMDRWSRALGERVILDLRNTVSEERAAYGLPREGHYHELHVARDATQDKAWVSAVETTGAVWGPYCAEAVTLHGHVLPSLINQAFIPSGDQGPEEVDVVLHTHSDDLPQRRGPVH